MRCCHENMDYACSVNWSSEVDCFQFQPIKSQMLILLMNDVRHWCGRHHVGHHMRIVWRCWRAWRHWCAHNQCAGWHWCRRAGHRWHRCLSWIQRCRCRIMLVVDRCHEWWLIDLLFSCQHTVPHEIRHTYSEKTTKIRKWMVFRTNSSDSQYLHSTSTAATTIRANGSRSSNGMKDQYHQKFISVTFSLKFGITQKHTNQ